MAWQQEVQAPNSCSKVQEENNKDESKTVYTERNMNKSAWTIVCPDWPNLYYVIVYIMKGIQCFSILIVYYVHLYLMQINANNNPIIHPHFHPSIVLMQVV